VSGVLRTECVRDNVLNSVKELIDWVGVDPTIYVQGRGTQAPFRDG
jgi:hypothetical protein